MSKAFIYEVTCTKEFTTWVEADCAAEAEDAARRGIEDPEHWETKAVQVLPLLAENSRLRAELAEARIKKISRNPDEIRRALAIAERVEARANDKRLLTSRVVAQQITKEADELLKEGK